MTSYQVADSYVHREKLARFAGLIDAGRVRLKSYEIAPRGEGVAPDISALAHDLYRTKTAQPESGEELGFTITHRCGASFHFLMIMTWRNENEIWETVWALDRATSAEPWLVNRTEPPRAAFCLWELGVVLHERKAWERFVLGKRDAAGAEAWARDVYEGPV